MGIDDGLSFLGSGWAFPPRFRRDGAVGIVGGEQDIRESLRLILSTTPGERVMHPTFGCNLRAIVFESIDEGVKTRIKEMIVRAVTQFEHRVQIDLVAVHVDENDEALLNIELSYRLRATNTAANLVFPFYLAGGRDDVAGNAP